jgi:hypothetical protein
MHTHYFTAPFLGENLLLPMKSECFVGREIILRRCKLVVFGKFVMMDLEKTGYGIEEKIIRKDCLFVLAERSSNLRIGFRICRGEVDPKRDMNHIFIERAGCMGIFQIFTMVGTIYHALQIEIGCTVFIDFFEKRIRVE